MPTEALIKSGTPIVVADLTDYAGDLGARTDQIDLTSIATLAARQSDKIDLGAVRAAIFAVTIAIEFAVAPGSGAIVSVWWAPSSHATAGLVNPGGVVGVDGAYSGTGGDSLADSILQCDLVGNLICTSDIQPAIQYETFPYSPLHRYGTVLVWNQTLQAFDSDAIKMGVALTPIIDEAQ